MRERERESERDGMVEDDYNDEQGKDISNSKRVFKDMNYIGKVKVPYFYCLVLPSDRILSTLMLLQINMIGVPSIAI